MHGIRHHSPARSGRSILGLLSVLALLASACFVSVAQADSSGIEYRDAPPSATGGQIPTSEPPATTSKKKGGAQSQGDSKNSGASKGGSSEEENAGGGATGTNGGGTNQGNPGQGESNPGAASKAGKIAIARSLGKAHAGDSSGGSSPLVPILIAIAAVMAIAIAVVVIRQRRQRGGPDGHISPEAS